MKNARIILCTCPEEETARRLAAGLVEQRLAACVNVLPGVTSVYRWQGKVETDSECLMLVKTSEARVAALTQWLHEAHHYELPEIVAVPIVAGLEPYLAWVIDETNDNQD